MSNINRYSVGSTLFKNRPFSVSYPKNKTCGMNIPTIPQNREAIRGFAYFGIDWNILCTITGPL